MTNTVFDSHGYPVILGSIRVRPVAAGGTVA